MEKNVPSQKFFLYDPQHRPAVIKVGVYILCSGLLFLFSVFRSDQSLLAQIGLFFLGLVFFTFLEYTSHRFLLHPLSSKSEKVLFPFVHQGHHRDPRYKPRIDLPLSGGLIVSFLLLLVVWLVFGLAGFSFFSGFLLGYAYYVMIHYLIHSIPPPKNRFGYLWEHHAMHHYVDHRKAFSISCPVWDMIFFSMPRKQSKTE